MNTRLVIKRSVILVAVLVALASGAWWWMIPFRDPRLVGDWISDADPDTGFREPYTFSEERSASDADAQRAAMIQLDQAVVSWEVRGGELRISRRKDLGLRSGKVWQAVSTLWNTLRFNGRLGPDLLTRRFEIVEVEPDLIELWTLADNHRPAGRVVVLRRVEAKPPPPRRPSAGSYTLPSP